jgi:hypothetical protein
MNLQLHTVFLTQRKIWTFVATFLFIVHYSFLEAQCSPCSPSGGINFASNTTISSSACYTSVTMANNVLVTVPSGVTLTVCGDWIGNNNDGITVNSGGTLIITGALDINNTFLLNSNGSVSIGSISVNNSSSLSVGGTGSLTVSGDVTAGNSATINVSSGGSMSVDGDLSIGSGSITATGTLSVTGTVTGGTATIASSVYYVATTGSDSNSGISAASPFRTLTKAISVATLSSTTIHVASGTWGAGIVDDNISVTNSNITIIGAGKDVTIFDGDAMTDGTGERFMTISGTATNITISDMTIQDMDVNGKGGGIYVNTTGSVTLRDLIFSSCKTTSATANHGGGVCIVSGASSTIDRCTFTGCATLYSSSGSYGAAIYSSGTATIQNCLLYGNTISYAAGSSGGSGYITNNAGVMTIYSTTITKNTSSTTGGVVNFLAGGVGTSMTLKNCIIYGNTNATYTVYNNSTGTSVTLQYTLYDATTYNAGGGFSAGTGNLTNSDVDPIFMNTATNDYRISATSPAREAGTAIGPTVDIAQTNRASSGSNTGSSYDMGCYENACVSGTYYVNDASTSGDTWCTLAGSDSYAGTTSAPYLTLSAALKTCGCPGNTIRVDKGSYTDKGLIVSTAAVTGSQLTIQGAGQGVTVFDGGSTNRFMLINVSGEYINIKNMTLQNYQVNDDGGGISYTTTGDNNVVQDITFNACKTTAVSGNNGGGVSIFTGASSTIDRCTFTGCATLYSSSGSYGAAIYSAGTATIQNCLLYGNTVSYNASSSGGSGYITNNAGVMTIYNTTISKNISSTTGGVVNFLAGGVGTSMTLKNCIIYGNTNATYSVYNNSTGTSVTLQYTLYDATTYNAGGGFSAGTGNLTSSNPLFSNTASNDFTLTSTSPAKDVGVSAGMPTVDINQTARPYGLAFDMGCYEFKPYYYWVGGTGNWSQYATHWATSSGGTSYKSAAPTSSDFVIFDANSGGGTCTIDAAAYANDMTMTGYTGTIAGSASLDIHGSLVVGSGSSWSHSGTTSFKSTSTGKTITSNGKTLSCSLNFNGSGGAWTLQDALTTTASITLTAGTLTPVSNTITLGGNWANNGGTFTSGTSTVTFNGSTNATLSGSSSTAFYNVTVNKGTSVSNILEITGPMSMTGDLIMTNGLLKVTHASATIKQPINVSSIAIPSTAGIHINGGVMSGINATVNNRGLFKITTGTASIGTSSGNSLSLATGSSYIIDGSGTLNVTGRVEATGGSYTQSAGTVNVCTLSNGNTASGTGNANFDISSTSTLNITGGSILIKYPNSNAIPYSSLRITSGAGSKTISGGTILIGDGSSSSNFLIYSDVALNNLTLNASGNATLESAITANVTVTFTNGKFVLGNYNFTIGSSGLISGEGSSTYFVTSGSGVLTQKGINSSSAAGKKMFPIGLSNASYTPMVLANTGTSDDFSARVTSGVLSGGESGTSLTTKYVDRTWLISEGTSGGSTATVNLYWNVAEEQPQFSRTACFVTHYTGGSWDLSTATSASGNPYTTFRSGITSFSPFTVTSTSALPIELISFQANCANNNTVDITWSTASEYNTNYFRLDKSRDGSKWDVLNTIGAAGNSNNVIDYALTDAFPNPGINYYRLTQYDNDGVFETFDAQAAVCKALSSYPNPSSADFNVDLQTDELEGDAILLITDAKGAVVHSQDIKIIKGNNNFVIQKFNAEPGIYYISVRTATSTVTTKHSMR